MGIENIDRMFQPQSIAVIGASEKKESIGAAIMENLIKGGFKGNIYPINPNHKSICKIKAHPSILDIHTPLDLAVIATPIISVPHIVRECVEAGTAGAVIISAGGKETGAQGKNLEHMIKKEIKDSDLRIIGPNCLGIISTKSKVNASFASHMPLPGKMAFISQSGAICTSILDLSIKEKFGFSYFVSLGSMLDMDFADMIDYIGSDPEVSSIVMYVEALTRFRNFMSAARAVSRVKPLIVFKSGRSSKGAIAAASHTGAMVGEDHVYDAAFKRAGIVRVKTFEELFDCSELFSRQPAHVEPGLAIITNAGGPGVMAVDFLSDYGMEPVSLSPVTISKIDEILPSYWSHGNPIDMTGGASADDFQKVVDVCIHAPEIKGLLIMFAPVAGVDPAEVAYKITEVIKQRSVPVITSWIGGADAEKGREIFNREGIPTFDSPERSVRAFMNLYIYSKNIEMLHEIPSKFSGKLSYDNKKAKNLIRKNLDAKDYILTEVESKEVLCSYGIPVNQTMVAYSPEGVSHKAKQLGFPVVLKINSRDITHKTDANCVFLNLTNENDVKTSFEQIIKNGKLYNSKAEIEGVTIQRMVKGMNYELILGTKKDRDFGPVILFGMGGIATEVLKDKAIALPPLNRQLARRLIEETKVYVLLQGFRNMPPVNLEIIEDILIRLSMLVTDFAEIEEIDINPLFITSSNSLCAVDARIILKPSLLQPPLHMVISPYPKKYETYIEIENIGRLFIRPIRPEDAHLLTDLFNTLSPSSVYFRFFSPLKQIPHHMLARFTQIDYDREIAFVALSAFESEEKMLGVCRVIPQRNPKHAEVAVLVGDPWQGKGIGASLIRICLELAKKQGIVELFGMVLPENTHMIKLGQKLGFEVKRKFDSQDYELKIQLNKK